MQHTWSIIAGRTITDVWYTGKKSKNIAICSSANRYRINSAKISFPNLTQNTMLSSLWFWNTSLNFRQKPNAIRRFKAIAIIWPNNVQTSLFSIYNELLTVWGFCSLAFFFTQLISFEFIVWSPHSSWILTKNQKKYGKKLHDVHTSTRCTICCNA